MTKDKVHYAESIETFYTPLLKKWKRAEISGTLQEGDDPIKCWQELKKDVQIFLQLPQEVSPEEALEGLLPVQQVENRVDMLIKDIMACEEIDKKNGFGAQVGLLAYANETNPSIKAAYDLRMIQLKQKQPTP